MSAAKIPPNDISKYLAVRDRMRAGDMIMFSGSSGVSPLIRWATGSDLSHCAPVRQPADHWRDVQIIEATIEGKKNGVQNNWLGERLENYDDGGAAWWLSLSGDSRRRLDLAKFYAACGDLEGRVRYDVAGLFKSAVRRNVPIIGQFVFQKEDTGQMFCSAAAIELYERSGLLAGINNSKSDPQQVAEMRIYNECVQILGKKPRTIKRFNTV